MLLAGIQDNSNMDIHSMKPAALSTGKQENQKSLLHRETDTQLYPVYDSGRPAVGLVFTQEVTELAGYGPALAP